MLCSLPLRAPCALLCLTAAATGQPLFRGHDVLVVNDRPTPALYRITAGGAAQAIPLPFTPAGLAALCTTRRGEVLLGDHVTGSIHLVALDGTARTLATVPGALRACEDRDGSFLVTSFATRSIERVTRTGQVSTVLVLPAPTRPFDVVVDENGDYVYCNDVGSPKGVFHYSRTTGAVTPLYTGVMTPLPHGLAFFANGDLAVMDGVNDEIYRLDRATGSLTVFVSNATLGNNPESIVESSDGGFLLALEHIALGHAIVHVDSQGNVTPLTSGTLPFSNLEQVALVPSLTGPTPVTTGGTTTYPFGLDVPSQAGALYLVGLSGGLFFGFGPPNDPRQLSVEPDGLFLSTLFGGASSLLVGWIGALDASGRASLLMDLRTLPPGALAGITTYAQGLTLDAAAPNGIGAITTVLPVTFQ